MRKYILGFLLALTVFFGYAQFDESAHYITIDKSTIGTGDQVFILPELSTVYSDEKYLIKNTGTGTLTIDAFSLETIDEQLTIVLNADNDALVLIKDVNNANNWNVLSTTQTLDDFYQYVDIWAEENGGLSNNNTQWSYGNGAVGNIGVVLAQDMELYAVSLSAEVFGTSVSINVFQNGTTAQTETFTGNHTIQTLTTPVAFSAGDYVGFQTNTVVGTTTDARVTAHFRIAYQNVQGIRGSPGADGAQGAPGTDGIPSAVMRVPLTGQANVNGTNVQLLLGTPNINTIAGGSVAANTVTLPAGNFKITLEVSLNSTVQRANIGFRFLQNGALYSQRSGGNYIRSTGGHNEAGDTVVDYINFATPGTMTFESFIQAAGGTVNLEGANSRLLIQQLSN